MALKFIGVDCVPAYLALSTDIVTNTIAGLGLVGKTVYTTDDGKWFIVKSDLTLAVYKQPSLSND